MTLDKTRIRVAPFSNRIVIARFGKDTSVALETRDIMDEFWQALVQYSFDGKMPNNGESVEISFGGGNEHFKMVISRV